MNLFVNINFLFSLIFIENTLSIKSIVIAYHCINSYCLFIQFSYHCILIGVLAYQSRSLFYTNLSLHHCGCSSSCVISASYFFPVFVIFVIHPICYSSQLNLTLDRLRFSNVKKSKCIDNKKS